MFFLGLIECFVYFSMSKSLVRFYRLEVSSNVFFGHEYLEGFKQTQIADAVKQCLDLVDKMISRKRVLMKRG